MNKSKLIRHKFTEYFNERELHYRNVIQPTEERFNSRSKWIKVINDGRLNTLSFLSKFIRFKGKILELGAGSCWLSSELSRIKSVNKLYCLDMSEFILENVATHIMDYLEADKRKIVRVVGDFNKLYFKNEKFDYVVFDSSLHHIPENDLVKVLKKVFRVLKKDGKVVAIYEPFLSLIPIFSKYRRYKFGLHERKYGVTENIFTKQEWEKAFRKAGFKPHFIPCFLKTNNSLGFANLLKKLINNSFLRIPFSYFFPQYVIILEKI